MLTQDAGRSVIEAYLPRTLIDHWARTPESDPVWSSELEGCLMLCDMSGFTAMSERLARMGKEGAELMAGILNSFFTRMLGIAAGWGGIQMKFGGDAMLLYFGGASAEQRAAAAALEMQGAMGEFQSVPAGGEQHELRMRIGMHYGRFFAASLGEEDGALHYLLAGSDVNATAAVEGHANPGEVVASEACADRLRRAGAHLAPADGGCSRVIRIDASRPPAALESHSAPVDVLLQYIMRPLAERLAQGDARPGAAEHRRVTAVFINLLGIADLLTRSGPGEALAHVDRYIKIILENLARHGGFLAASDAAETGDKLIILFGAPVSSERDDISALRFAVDLQREFKAARLPLKHRIGMATGFVFAGEIGSPTRREYTVIGDTVNLAARLMAAAHPGDVFVSAITAERARSEFDLRPLRPLRVKGKSEVVRAFRLSGTMAIAASDTPPKPMYGRDRELEQLASLGTRAAEEGGAWGFVCGDAGIGKSTLVAQAARQFQRDGWHWIATRCQSQQSGTVLGAWIDVLRQVVGIDPRADPQQGWIRLRDEVRSLQPARISFAPLLADLLSLPSEREAMLEFLDGRRKRMQLNALIVGMVCAAARRRRLVLTFDDLHVADAPSRELLAEFLGHPVSGCLTIVGARGYTMPSEFSAITPDEWLSLSELSEDAARRIAAASGAPDDAMIDAIVARAQGNPMFVEEMSMNSSSGGDLPLTINEVILARLDRLPYAEKSVLKTAAVAGLTFAAPHVAALLDSTLTPAAVDGALDHLVGGGFLRKASEDSSTHAFSHILTQEVVYETLLFADRRHLHGTLGGHIERERSADLGGVAGTLLHHFERAGDVPKTVTYAVMTGERAARVFANREAMDYYARALDALQRLTGTHDADRSVLLERIGDCLEMDGRHRAATEAFSDALAAWRESSSRRDPIVPRDAALDRVREPALCRRIAVSYERRSEYDASIEWLDQAERLMPTRSAAVGSEVWASRSMALFRKGLYRDAIASGRRALSLARRSHDAGRIAYAQNMLANSYLEEGSIRQAIRQLQQAIETYEAIGDVYGMAAANNNIGNCYQALGDLDAARRHYDVALEANMRVGNDAAIVHNNMGEVLFMLGAVREAAIHLREVVRANETDPDLNAVAGLSHVNLSRCMVALGDIPAAEDHLQKGTQLLIGVGAEGLLQEARLQNAALMLLRGEREEALREASGVLHDAAGADAKMLVVSTEHIIGSACAELGRNAEAIEHLVAGATLARRIGAHQEEARLLIDLAALRRKDRPQTARAAAHLRRALQILAGMPGAIELIETAERLQHEISVARPPQRAVAPPSDSNERD